MASDTGGAVAKAVKKVEEWSLGKDARLEYEMRMKALSDYNSIIYDAKAEGSKEGIEKGIEKGVEEGKIKGKIDAVVNLVLATKMSVDEAMKILQVDSSFKKHIETELIKREI